MQPGGDKLTFFLGRPASLFSSPSQSSTPLRPSGPLAGLGATSAPQTTVPFLVPGPVAGPELSMLRDPAPSVRLNGPLSPPSQSSFSSQNANMYQHTQAPRFPPAAQPVSSLRGPSPMGPPVIPSPGSIHPQPQVSSALVNFPLQIANQMPFRGNMPAPLSLFSATRPPSHSPLHGYPNVLPRSNVPQSPADSQFNPPTANTQPPFQAFPATHLSAGQPPFNTHQGGVPTVSPPVGPPLSLNYRGQMQYPTAGPPTGGMLQGLVEDFQSLSVGSVPSSLVPGADPKSLPRPLDDEEEPTSILETYPFNCHPRFLRLTTHAIIAPSHCFLGGICLLEL